MPGLSLKRLTLRSRLLVAVGVVAFVQVAAAFLTVAYVSDELLDQADERLVAAAFAPALDDSAQAEVSGVYQGVLVPAGELVTSKTVSDRGEALPPPTVTDELLAADRDAATVPAAGGGVEYRALLVNTDSGANIVYAIPLDGYRWTMSRVIRLATITTVAVLVALGLVTWWIARLGIAPINRMTRAAERIAAGEGLAARIDYAPAGTEAGELGRALSMMMVRIEDSLQQQAHTEQMLRQFIADASHELRTPVATIRGYAELYRTGGLAEESDLDDAMERVLHESERMSRLITDLLHLARLDRQPDPQLRAVNLADLAEDVAADARARRSSTPLRAVGRGGPVIVRGDEDLLRQAIGNLVDNAIVHNPPGTGVVLRYGREVDRGTIAVSDNGAGMAPTVARRATERFFRGDPARQRDTGSSGLGLSIVASIVAAHGGDLDIDSSPNVGTSVRFSIPLFAQAPDSQQTPSALKQASEIDWRD